MPEIKHNFTSGKMNKDLDERLVPSGEYRDAMNIQVSTSEGSDVGTAQNILGNSLTAGQGFIPENAVCVGSIADEKNDKLYYFVTQKDLLGGIGSFDNNASGWDVDTNAWNISNGQAQAIFGQNGRIKAFAALYEGTTYRFTYDIVVPFQDSSGLLLANHAAGNANVSVLNENIVGTHSTEWVNGAASAATADAPDGFFDSFRLYCFDDGDGTIDNLTIFNADLARSFIVEYDSITNTITPVVVDTNNTVLSFHPNRLITGINVIDDMIFWTDNHSEPKKINISRCIEGTDKSGLIHTKLINESRGIDISSGIDLEEKHITVIRKSPRTAPTIELISGRNPNSTYSGIMRITTDPGGLSTSSGATNTQNASSLWYDQFNDKNYLYDFSTLTVGDSFRTNIETDINGDSGFDLDWQVGDTVVFKEFSGDTYSDAPSIPITDYTIKAKILSVVPSDEPAELAPNGDFTLPNINGGKPLGYNWSNVDIIYDSQNSKIVFDGVGASQEVTGTPSLDFEYGTGSAAGTYKVKFETQGMIAGSTVQVKLISNQGGASPHNWSTPTVNTNSSPGVPHEFDLTLDTTLGSSGGNFSYAAGKFLIHTASATNNSFEILNISIERQDVSDAGVELEVIGINSIPAVVPDGYSELRYAVDLLDEEENLFEFKFPRFAYRYQYEDKEYSAFSPFTEVAFLPGSFDFHPQKGYNLGMTNGLKKITIKNFIPVEGLVDDVVAVDILYKDEASPNIYVIDTINNNQHGSDIWLNNEYTIKSESVKRVLPSNQLLRPWDAVPKKALAQEISGNRIIYGNYTQGFDLLKPGTKQEYYPDFDFSIKSDNIGLNTVKSIKSLREYQLGVVFVDKYGRETPVLSNASGLDKVPKIEAAKSNKMEVSFGNTVFPEDMEYFKFFVKETSGEYYNMTMDRWWDAGDGLAWLSFGSADINKIDIDTFLILKKGVESNDLVTEPARYKVLAIETEAPDYIKTKKTLIEERTHVFVANSNTDIFSNTINDAPLLGRDTFKMRYQPFGSGPGSELHNIEDGILYVEFALGSVVSKRYRVTELTTDRDQETAGGAIGPNAAFFSVKLDKNLGEDVNFICDDPNDGLNATKIIDNATVRVYKYTPENSSEFDGRFFVKVISDGVFIENVATTNAEVTQYRTTLSRKLYYMGSDQAALHSEVLTGQTHGLYQDASGGTGYLGFSGGGVSNNLGFGSFASFFRNYKYTAASESIGPTITGSWNVGQYRFDDTSESEWKGELVNHMDTTITASNPGYYDWSGTSLKNADHSGLDDEVDDASARYGVFNASGEQTKGSVWFIDGGPYAGTRSAGQTNLHWPYHGQTNGFETGISTGNMLIAMGGIYNPGEVNDSSSMADVFNIGSSTWYSGQKFKDLVGKISPSVKFKFREDPTGEVYTIKPSGVTYVNRLRWSEGGKNYPTTGVNSGEYPAYGPIGSVTDVALAPQLSPNITRGYHTKFTNEAGNGDVNWDPTGGGTTGSIDNGLHLTAIRSTTTPSQSGSGPMFVIAVDDIHDLTCSVNGGKYSITKGMILTSYGGITLDGTFTDPNGNAGGNYSHEPLIVQNITGTGPYVVNLTGYSSPILGKINAAGLVVSSTDLLPHKVFDTAPAAGESMVFQQPAMNGYSQYSVNRINVQNANGDGSSLSNPALLAVGYTIEFLEEIESDVEFPDNPAIWETEPKESTDLDIYYEASGYNPLTLTEDSKYLVIPSGSLVECVENPAATLVNMIVTQVNNEPLPDSLSPGQNGTGPWRLSLATKFTQDEPLVGTSYIQIGSHLKITKPDGSIITVEVTGWDASTATTGNNFTSYPTRTPFIYISEVLHGPDTKYTLSWHNCYSFGNGVESNRIRDTYNLPYIANGVKASTTLDEHPYEENLKYGLIYSGIYNGSVGINNLNQFIAAEKISKDINPTYGSIQKLKAGWGQGGDLITLCEDRVLKIMANKDALYNADGNPQLLATNAVLGQAIPYSGEFGISKNPESFASEAYRAYFTDKVRGAVMRLSMDGLTPISNAGMKDWFRDNLKLSTKLIGSYDDRNDEYNITLAGRETLGEELISNGRFDDDSGWTISGGSGTQWIINNGVAQAGQGTDWGYMEIDAPGIIEGKTYRITYDIVVAATAGNFILANHTTDTSTLNSTTGSNNVNLIGETAVGAYSIDWLQGPNNTGKIKLYNDSNFDGTIDNISVKEIIYDPITVSFKEDVKGWVSFKSFVPENALSAANNYYTLFGGRLYKHHVENVNRNTFYNTFTNSSLNVLLNDMPSSIKSYHTLEYEGSRSRVEGVKTVEVVSGVSLIAGVNPGNNPNGYYFYFNAKEEMDTVLGYSYNHGDEVEIKQYRNNALVSTGFIKVFSDPAYGVFGRYNFNPQAPSAGDFEAGDVITTQLQEDSVDYFNSTPTDGWYVSNIETNKEKGSLLEFIEKEGKWFNHIKGIESNIDETTDFASFDIQGLGILKQTITSENSQEYQDDQTANNIFALQLIEDFGWDWINNVMEFDGEINSSLQIGDIIYYQQNNNSTLVKFGEVTSININSIVVDETVFGGANIPDPTHGAFIFFVKNQVINMNGLSGYYADARFENNSKVKAELFAVSSEVTESSK